MNDNDRRGLRLYRILIIAEKPTKAAELESGLSHMGFACAVVDSGGKVNEAVVKPDIDLALVDMNGSAASAWGKSVWEQLQDIRQRKQLPIIAILSEETLDRFGSALEIDDFIVQPCDLSELAARLRRAAKRIDAGASDESIKCGDLVIDQAKCEVSLSGKLIPLTFREYELLKFLASNKERVFTRESLLNRVWGYDYYGGDRTVDVHVRRLRGKIEDSSHTFIETVRNIGYRFRNEKELS